MKKILLTGRSGFIGRNISNGLKEEYIIEAPGRESLDLLDADMVEKVLEIGQYDVVIHTANVNTTKMSVSNYVSLNGNLQIFCNLERCSDLYGKMIYFGSGAEYDMNHYVPFMEENYRGKHIPQDPYGFSKYMMAKLCENHSNIYDLCLFGVYGPYEEWHRRFISNNICRNLKGLPMTINQNVYFDYLFVEDLLPILRWFIEHNPKYKHYNICRGEHIDLYTLANLINKVMQTDTDILVKKEGWKKEYSGSNRRLIAEVDGLKFHTYEEGIRCLVEYYFENQNNIDDSQL